MQYVHVKNIEKYNPGYKDRQHIWAKIYWSIFIDENYQQLTEIDRHRLIGLIVFETYTQKSVALTPTNIVLLGWETKKRPISQTLQMLHKFIEVRNENVTQSRVYVQSRVEESRLDIYVDFEKSTLTSWNSFCDKFPILPKIKEISDKRRVKLKQRFTKDSFRDFAVILKAIENQPFLMGENQRKWKVSFDWLIENDTNYLKILEHKYKDHQSNDDIRQQFGLKKE